MLVLALAFAGCGASAQEKASEHPPLVVLVDRADLMAATESSDPLKHLRRHGRRLDAPRYEGWFHDMAELYYWSEHRLRVGTISPQLEQWTVDIGDRSDLWLSVFGYADRSLADRIEAIDPAAADLGRFHTEFVDGNQVPGWPDEPELEVAGPAMRAWARAYPGLIRQIRPRMALVIAWDGIASADRVGELAGG